VKTLKDVRDKLLKRWEKGDFYTTGSSSDLFPLRVPLSPPSASVITKQFDQVRGWISGFSGSEHRDFRIEWKDINHRLWGKNRLPSALFFDRPEDLARFISRFREWETFGKLYNTLTMADSRLAEQWASRYPFDLLASGPDLERLIRLWRWMTENPRPGIYLRQIDLPEIDTKFTEKYKKILSVWLDITQPEGTPDAFYSGVKHFEERYGYRRKPELIRFRILDQDLTGEWRGCKDMSLPADDFCRLYKGEENCPWKQIFVIENDISALSFPNVEKGLVVFGRGYNFRHWKKAEWLHRTNLWYWGDLDTHGFRILDQFRSYFPEAVSILMDRAVLLNHESSWGREGQPVSDDLTRLTSREKDVYNDLRFNRIRENLRLEQEFIQYGVILKELTLRSVSSL